MASSSICARSIAWALNSQSKLSKVLWPGKWAPRYRPLPLARGRLGEQALQELEMRPAPLFGFVLLTLLTDKLICHSRMGEEAFFLGFFLGLTAPLSFNPEPPTQTAELVDGCTRCCIASRQCLHNILCASWTNSAVCNGDGVTPLPVAAGSGLNDCIVSHLC